MYGHEVTMKHRGFRLVSTRLLITLVLVIFAYNIFVWQRLPTLVEPNHIAWTQQNETEPLIQEKGEIKHSQNEPTLVSEDINHTNASSWKDNLRTENGCLYPKLRGASVFMVSHSGSRNGAVIVLHQFVSRLVKCNGICIIVLLITNWVTNQIHSVTVEMLILGERAEKELVPSFQEMGAIVKVLVIPFTHHHHYHITITTVVNHHHHHEQHQHMVAHQSPTVDTWRATEKAYKRLVPRSTDDYSLILLNTVTVVPFLSGVGCV